MEKEQENITETKKETKKQKKSLTKRIINIIITLVLIFVVGNVAIGLLNMNKINNGEEPIWYTTKEEKKTSTKETTTYDILLFKIVKTSNAKGTTTSMKAFFLN